MLALRKKTEGRIRIRSNQPAVAGLLGWPIVTITINPRSRGCLAGPWFAMRDRDNVCAASEVKKSALVKSKTRSAAAKKQKGGRLYKFGWLVVKIRLAGCKK